MMIMLDLLPDLCDEHGDALRIADPLFHDYGGKALFYGEAVTLSCFEDNSLVRELVNRPGHGKTEKRGLGTLDTLVSFAGVTIAPGDYVYADLNGVLVSGARLL
jgi:regulator of ribonuclease activity A